MSIAVAIDGPVGAGKSSIAKECAKRLGFIYVDTGAMYRCIGLFCDRNGVDMDDPVRVSAALSHISLDVKIKDGTQHIYLNGYDVSDEIRLPEISMAASKVSAIPKIYLTADAEVRAKRRYDELIAKGTAVSYESVLTDLKQRDHNDMTREIAPLKQADDAVLADTTELDFEGSCDLLVRIIKEKAEIR